MKKTLLAATFLLNSLSFTAQTNWNWARSGGSTANDFAGGTDYNSSTISTDANGNSYVTGLFNGTATFGTYTISSGGAPAILVVKYDANGTCQWAKKIATGNTDGDPYGNEGKAVRVDNSGNCYVTGVFRGPSGNQIVFGSSTLNCTGNRQIFLVKYDSNGNELWAAQSTGAGSYNSYAKSVTTDANGNVYITGYVGGGNNTFGSSTVNSAGAYVVKFNSSGAAQWATKLGSNGGGADAICIDVDEFGNTFTSGYLQGTEYFATSPSSTLTSIGMRSVFVAKVDSTGAITWVKQFGGGTAYGKAISVDGSGNVFITGNFEGSLSFGSTNLSLSHPGAYVVKLDNNGNPVWAFQYNNSSQGGGWSTGTAIKANAGGDCFMTGYYYPAGNNQPLSFCNVTFPNQGNQTMYVIRINADSTLGWSKFSEGSGSSSISSGISLDGNDNVYVSGYHQGTQILGTNTITSAGAGDVFIGMINNQQAMQEQQEVSVKELIVNNKFNIYPNPASGFITINSGIPVYDLKIVNMLGQTVLRTSSDQQQITLNISEIGNKGVYFVQLLSKEGKNVETKKLIIK